MWEIKSYNKKGKEVTLQNGFSNKEEAELFLSHEYREKEDVFVVETKSTTVVNVDISDKMGQWIWLFSPKKQEMFPYGILRKQSSMFVKIQTREDETDYMAEIRVSTVQKWLETGKGELRSEGHFVVTKEYV